LVSGSSPGNVLFIIFWIFTILLFYLYLLKNTIAQDREEGELMPPSIKPGSIPGKVLFI
jgi:hypothetical protein